eukprot:2883090-Alexandrium_andersonii.AAC.1
MRPSPSTSLPLGGLASCRPQYLARSASESQVDRRPSRLHPMNRILAARTARLAVIPHAGWTVGRAAGSTGSLATTSAAPAAAKN